MFPKIGNNSKSSQADKYFSMVDGITIQSRALNMRRMDAFGHIKVFFKELLRRTNEDINISVCCRSQAASENPPTGVTNNQLKFCYQNNPIYF
ncbi:unnamed protein product [Moneuplotes crassus]|uniref:Uncharacterized protein n=1 Tax=Euplotes crassus TaxID=5936 RepID=A0AAD1XTI1_EUPCR|nr:unnamed protein product [Moneuplotes crassus]